MKTEIIRSRRIEAPAATTASATRWDRDVTRAVELGRITARKADRIQAARREAGAR